jgi:mannose-1-phosphate guanylyltransferase
MIDETHPVYALILAGGAGTRFWPASRAARPKQMLALLGGDPLLLETARRVLPLCGRDGAGWSRLLVASGEHLAEPTASLLPELPRENLLIEPVARNTAPCIGWAAATVARRDPDAVLMVLPSDHHIADTDRFRAALERAATSARGGAITTIGIQPTCPETGYGYIEVKGEAASAGGTLAVQRFVEKPHRALAEEFVASGRYLWNAGMFFFRARDMLAALAKHQPALAEGLCRLDRAAASGGEAEELAQIFPALPSISIDKGVMEHLSDLAVVPGDFGWNDIGSWQSAWELADKDPLGNAAPPGTVLVDARNNHVVDLRQGSGGRRVIALAGVEDLVVVETEDALLIVPRARAQDVKEIVEQLKTRGDTGLI